MSTILSNTIIKNAQETTYAYIKNANLYFGELETALNSLMEDGFSGEAADGFKTFFTQKITPALNEYLTTGDQALMPSINQMLEDIRKQLIDTVDPALGNANKGAGGSDGQQTEAGQ